MDSELVLAHAPTLDPAWLEHEKAAGLLETKPAHKSMADRRRTYDELMKTLTREMLAGRDKHLSHGIDITEFSINARDGHPITICAYQLSTAESVSHISSNTKDRSRTVIYYHGGGLRVGDLESEDLSCRRICMEGACTVFSVNYRLTPENPMDIPVNDAWDAYVGISERGVQGDLVLVGSSSGGQLAAQITQFARDSDAKEKLIPIRGLVLRCPVTVRSFEGGSSIPTRFRKLHTSCSVSFETSLLNLQTEPTSPIMPLDAATFEGLPPTYIQLCTNDVYYSDGLCYGTALVEAGVPVKHDVYWGWPHTFWLKAPKLERALEVDMDMMKGIEWLFSLSEDARE
jgi:acetyl esterase/lipase